MSKKDIRKELNDFVNNFGNGKSEYEISKLFDSYQKDDISNIYIENDSMTISSKGDKVYFYLYVFVPFISFIFFAFHEMEFTNNELTILGLVIILFLAIMPYYLFKEKMIYNKHVTFDKNTKTIKIDSEYKFIKKHSKLFNNFSEFCTSEFSFTEIEEFFRDNHRNYYHDPLQLSFVIKLRLKGNGVITICATSSKTFADEFSNYLNYIVNNCELQV